MKVREIYKQQIQIGDNVTDILKLPCVEGVFKVKSYGGVKEPHEGELRYCLTQNHCTQIARKGDWLCEGYDGRWTVIRKEAGK